MYSTPANNLRSEKCSHKNARNCEDTGSPLDDGDDHPYRSALSRTVEIVDDEVSAMKKDLEQEIEAFVDENDFKLAKGQDGFKAAGLFPYLFEGREHLIKRDVRRIRSPLKGTIRPAQYMIKP